MRTSSRALRSLCLLVVCLALAFSVSIPSVRGQDIQSQLSQRVGELSDRVNSGTDGDAQKIQRRADERLGAIESSLERSDQVSIRDPRFEIASHHRGNDGIPFPTASQVVLDHSLNAASESTSQKAPDYWVPRPRKVSRPPTCERSGTSVVQRREKGNEKEIVLDRLYLSQELSPVDSSDIYGVNTTVYAYDGENGAEVLLRMEADGVPCVPYRIRYTDTTAFYHKGEDALCNYDKDPTGRGQIDSWVNKQMHGAGQ